MSNEVDLDRKQRQRLSRRAFLRGALAVSAAGLAAGCAQPTPAPAPTKAPAPAAPVAAAPTAPAAAPTAAPAPAQLTKLRVGWTIAPHQSLVGLALSKGWFKEAGLDVELTGFDSGQPLFEAMGAGKLDIGLSGSTPPISFAASGAVPIHMMGTQAESSQLFTIISRKSIATPADVKGKTALTTTGSVNHYFLDLMLDKFGLTEKDIKLVHMEQSEAVTAFIGNQGDFASLGTAFWTQILDKSPDAKVLFTGKDMGVAPGKIMQAKLMELMTVYKDYGDKNLDTVAKFLNVLLNRTHKYYNDAATKQACLDELSAWLKKTINSPLDAKGLGDQMAQCTYWSAAEQAKLFETGVFKASIDAQADYLVQTGRFKQAAAFDSWCLPKYVQAAAKLA